MLNTINKLRSVKLSKFFGLNNLEYHVQHTWVITEILRMKNMYCIGACEHNLTEAFFRLARP